MSQNPLDGPCPHIATPQEQTRDPDYLACNAVPGEPCRWGRRYDGLTNPSFHCERLEAALRAAAPGTPPNPDLVKAAILESGLI